MPRVKTYRFPKDGIDEAELKELLEEAGCEPIDDVAKEPTESSDDDGVENDAEALIVVLTPELQEHAELEAKLVRVIDSGCRVIGVWPKGAKGGSPPRAVENYSTNQITWNAEHLRLAVTGAVEPRYDSPHGEPRERPATQTNKC